MGGIDRIDEIRGSPVQKIHDVLFPDVFFIGVVDEKMGIEIGIVLK